MIPVLRKVAQLNIKYRKKWESHNRCLHRGPPDAVPALEKRTRYVMHSQRGLEKVLKGNQNKTTSLSKIAAHGTEFFAVLL